METGQQPQPRRITDTSNRDAKAAVASVVARFSPWRLSIAQMRGAAGHGRLSNADRQRILNTCDEIERDIAVARTELIAELMDAPAKVTSNTRVVDVERALDNIEAALGEVRAAVREN